MVNDKSEIDTTGPIPDRDEKRTSRRKILTLAAGAAGTLVIGGALYALLGNMNRNPGASLTPTPMPGRVAPLDPHSIPKYVNQLVVPPAYMPDAGGLVTVDVTQFTEQILPALDVNGKPTGFGPTTVWGYGGPVRDPLTGRATYFRNSPAATFEATRGVPIRVKWQNKITTPHLHAVDPTLHWANPNNLPMSHMPAMATVAPAYPPGYPDAQSPVPISPHLHGGETPSQFDGHPDAWFTADGRTGPAYVTSEYTYLNSQPPATIWYHDHAMGMTRINVYAGLAGFYLIRDPDDPVADLLPRGEYEIPLAIQDRMFYEADSVGNNEFSFPANGDNPDIHPYWLPEFFGDSIMVNGKVWPNLDVDQGQYRFRLLNGSNARFYNLKFSNGMAFVQIGTDGGYLKSAVSLKELLLAPGERADILVDFTGLAAGSKLVLLNDASVPYPNGDPVDNETTGQVMQFTVGNNQGFAPRTLPGVLNDTLAGPSFPTLTDPSVTRVLTLVEVMGEKGPIMAVLDGQKFDAPVTELPKAGAVEEWVIANLTGDTHPIHLHLVQFQLLNRHAFDAEKYLARWLDANKAGLDAMGMPPLSKPTVPVALDEYLTGDPIGPDPNETGWKDTVRMNPGEVTRIRVKFAPIDGSPEYPFDVTAGPGYVWHCHIIDHEDNEMMRPYKVVQP